MTEYLDVIRFRLDRDQIPPNEAWKVVRAIFETFNRRVDFDNVLDVEPLTEEEEVFEIVLNEDIDPGLVAVALGNIPGVIIDY